MEIKIVIDFDNDPMYNADAVQVVYVNGIYTPIDTNNIIGKYITGVELDKNTHCLILSLEEELPEMEKTPNPNVKSPKFQKVTEGFNPDEKNSDDSKKEDKKNE